MYLMNLVVSGTARVLPLPTPRLVRKASSSDGLVQDRTVEVETKLKYKIEGKVLFSLALSSQFNTVRRSS